VRPACCAGLDELGPAPRSGDRPPLRPPAGAPGAGRDVRAQIVWYGSTRTPFTRDFIDELLHAAGFREVIPCAYRETASRYPEIVDFDNRERESLFVEATK
jgi:hypothetical protein